MQHEPHNTMRIEATVYSLMVICLLMTSGLQAQTPFSETQETIAWERTVEHAAAFEARAAHTSVVFDNKMWILGGLNRGGSLNDVWWSIDGITWNQSTASAGFSQRYGHASVVFDNKMWVVAGSGRDDVWWSDDGETWNLATNRAPFGKKFQHSCLAFDDKMWVIAGSGLSNNDVWCSSDGVNWNLVTAHAAFPTRMAHASVVFDDKMWVIGGNIGYNRWVDDVWWSDNGSTWRQATAHADFDPRVLHAAAVYDGKMWIMGGNKTTAPYGDGYAESITVNEAWWSVDGVTWTMETVQDNFSPRHSLTSVVHDDKLWILCGMFDFKNFFNDAWYSTPQIPTTPTPTPTPYPVSIITPNGGEVYDGGMPIDVRWRTDLDRAGSSVGLELWNAHGLVDDLGRSWDPDGEGNCEVLLPLVPEGSDYRIRIASTWDPQYWDESDEPFTITGAPLRLHHPNGGEIWQDGATEWIWWESNPSIAGTAVRFELWRTGEKVAEVGLAWNENGEDICNVTVPDVAPAEDYLLRLVSVWNNQYYDESDGFLVIDNDDYVPPVVKLAVEPDSWILYR